MKQTNNPVAVWVIGPAGSGKSWYARRLSSGSVKVLNQDRLFERCLRLESIPLDFRVHQPQQAERARLLRRLTGEHAWQEVKKWRESGCNCIIETTGDKPDYLEIELRENSHAGLRNAAILIDVPLTVCCRRNEERDRIMADVDVRRTWERFQASLRDGVYERFFGTDTIVVTQDTSWASIENWYLSQVGDHVKGLQ